MELRTPLSPSRATVGAPLSLLADPAPADLDAPSSLAQALLVSAGADSDLPGAGLPQDRHARVAAQRSFLALRQQFIDAVGTLDDGYRNRWLLRQVSQAQDPVDLWLMRGAVFTSLQTLGEVADRAINALERSLEQVFPDGGQMQPLPPLLR